MTGPIKMGYQVELGLDMAPLKKIPPCDSFKVEEGDCPSVVEPNVINFSPMRVEGRGRDSRRT